MKKSEMTKKLKNKITELGFYKQLECGCCHVNMSLNEAEQILDFLTEEGMLAPTTQLSKINAKDNAWED